MSDVGPARDWTPREHQIYEVGHNEGESCRQADWSFALTEICTLPEGVDAEDPSSVARYIASLQLRRPLSAQNRRHPEG